MKLLLADDDVDRARDLARAFAHDTSIVAVTVRPGELLADAVAAHAPDVVLVDMTRPDRDTLEGVRVLSRRLPHPVVLFVDEDDPGFMEEAIAAGVCSYNVGTVTPAEVRPVLRAAVALFRHLQGTRTALDAAEARLRERSLLDQAKSRLMRERRLSEPEAHRWLQRRAMATGAKLTEIAQRVVESSGSFLMSAPIRFGLLRLADSAPAVVADAHGLFAGENLDVALHIEPSWANVADKLAWDALDAAIMLTPLALAATVGLRGRATRLRVPMGISRGGNSLVVGTSVPDFEGAPAEGFARWLASHATPPRFAVVHVFSMHNLLLRHWLAGAGANPDQALEIVVVPPARIVEELAAGRIVGFCAGAPWGDHARDSGAGRVLLGTSAIRPGHIEKCLALREDWSDTHPEAAAGLARALRRAQAICETGGADIAALVAERLDLPARATRASLPGGDAVERVGFAGAAALHPAEAGWALREMRRWGWLAQEPTEEAILSAALAR